MRLEVRALPPERLRHSATDVVEHQEGITNLPREGRHHTVPSSRGLGHHPLKVETRVRTPLGLPAQRHFLTPSVQRFVFFQQSCNIVGNEPTAVKANKRYRDGAWRLTVAAGSDPLTGRRRTVHKTVHAPDNQIGRASG